MVMAGKPTTQASDMLSAPTARPPSRSTTTASVRTSASATGASASHRRALARGRTAPLGPVATRPRVAESVVGSRIDTFAAVSWDQPQVLELARRPPARAPQACAYNHEGQTADDQQ